MLKEEIEEKTTAGILEDHSEEFLSLANGVAEETESEVRVTWQTTPYSVEVRRKREEKEKEEERYKEKNRIEQSVLLSLERTGCV